jgi:hypothetical protein
MTKNNENTKMVDDIPNVGVYTKEEILNITNRMERMEHGLPIHIDENGYYIEVFDAFAANRTAKETRNIKAKAFKETSQFKSIMNDIETAAKEGRYSIGLTYATAMDEDESFISCEVALDSLGFKTHLGSDFSVSWGGDIFGK